MNEQDTLLNYEPSKEEEIARLKKKAAENTERIETILADPVIAEFQSAAKKLDKKMKEIEKLRSENSKLEVHLAEALIIEVAEPAEDGYYIFTKGETNRRWRHHSNKEVITVTRSLYLKAMGYWFDLSGGGSTAPDPDRHQEFDSFTDLLNIDTDTIEASIAKLEDISTYPTKLLEKVEEESSEANREKAPSDETDEEDEE